jgi:hypothetical protein
MPSIGQPAGTNGRISGGLIVMAGRVPAIFAPADEARMGGTRPAMTDSTRSGHIPFVADSTRSGHIPSVADSTWLGHIPFVADSTQSDHILSVTD